MWTTGFRGLGCSEIDAVLSEIESSIDAATDIPVEMMEAMIALTFGVEVDLDAPIYGDVVI
jgi:hypothetical protein